MGEFENGTPQFPVEELWVDAVTTEAVDIDWSAAYRDGEGWRSVEAPSCEDCYAYAVWAEDVREWQCPNAECENHGGEVEDDSEGPMMNYYYPVAVDDRVGSLEEAATMIRDLPLCVVEFEGGTQALALTGGGMDLSWEICEAFTRLGYLPPLKYADLPGMAGRPRGADDQYVIDACIRSAVVAAGWADTTVKRLRERYRTVPS